MKIVFHIFLYWFLLPTILSGCIGSVIEESTDSFYASVIDKDNPINDSSDDGTERLSIIAEDIIRMKEKFKNPTVNISREEIYQGELLFVKIDNIGKDYKLDIDIEELGYNFHKILDKNTELVLIPISVFALPKKYDLNIKIYDSELNITDESYSINILGKDFEKHYMYISETLKAVRSETNIINDGVYIKEAKSSSPYEKLWKGEFINPVIGWVSTEFGIKRYLNDVYSNIHTGLDISAVAGTEIAAANDGIIKLSRELIVTGNTIILDHGMNLFTGYSHLSKSLVKVGDYVKKGDIIGLVGSTGFSTGPHLHWTITVDTTYLSPRFLMDKENMNWLEEIILNND